MYYFIYNNYIIIKILLVILCLIKYYKFLHIFFDIGLSRDLYALLSPEVHFYLSRLK